jgi:hypothetical protein
VKSTAFFRWNSPRFFHLSPGEIHREAQGNSPQGQVNPNGTFCCSASYSNYNDKLLTFQLAISRRTLTVWSRDSKKGGSNRKAGVRGDQQRERHGASERETVLEVRLYIDIPKSLCGPGCITSHLLGATIETTRAQRGDAASECKQGRGA